MVLGFHRRLLARVDPNILLESRRLTLRPRAQRHLRNSTLLIATGAASSLHGHSLQDSHHITGQVGWVSVSRKIALSLCASKAASQRTFASGAKRGHFLPHGTCGISACQCTLDQETSCGDLWIVRHADRAAQYLFDNIPRPRRCQSFLKIGERPLHVSIKNLTKELLLVAKSSVKARSIDTHGPGQVRERRSFVTLGPKNVHRAFQGHVWIEDPRPSDFFRNGFMFHTNR